MTHDVHQGPGGRGRAGPRRGVRGAPDPTEKHQKAEAAARAEELVRTSGVPLALAMQVVREQRTLNDVVTQLAREAEVERLIARHGMNRALATQVARGDAQLMDVLRKARMLTHLSQHRERSLLTDAVAKAAPVALGVHGAKVLRGRITAVDVYDIDFAPDEGEAIRLPKVRIKFAYDPGHYKQIRKNLSWDASRKGASEPVLRPQDRYGCSDKRLFRYLDSAVTVAVTTLEGEVFTGKVAWMGRWEFGLKLEKSDVEVVFWRHALADIAEDK